MHPDPLAPTRLEVLKDMTTTSSVTVIWTYDKSILHVERWRVQYKLKGQSIIKSVDTSSAEILRKTIGGLSSGENYTIYVYGITRGGIVSQDAAVLDITVSKCLTYFVLPSCPI